MRKNIPTPIIIQCLFCKNTTFRYYGVMFGICFARFKVVIKSVSKEFKSLLLIPINFEFIHKALSNSSWLWISKNHPYLVLRLYFL